MENGMLPTLLTVVVILICFFLLVMYYDVRGRQIDLFINQRFNSGLMQTFHISFIQISEFSRFDADTVFMIAHAVINRIMLSKLLHQIESPKITKEYTFALLSDLHNKSFGKQNGKLIAKIEELAPDAVLVAGDMLTAIEKNNQIRPPLRVFFKIFRIVSNQNLKFIFLRCPQHILQIAHRHRISGKFPIITSVYLQTADIDVRGRQIDLFINQRFNSGLMEDLRKTALL